MFIAVSGAEGIPLLGYVSQVNTRASGLSLLGADHCFAVWPAVAKSTSDNQSSMISQSAGRPKSILELGAAEKQLFSMTKKLILLARYRSITVLKKIVMQYENLLRQKKPGTTKKKKLWCMNEYSEL
jgi:hypothetical protein